LSGFVPEEMADVIAGYYLAADRIGKGQYYKFSSEHKYPPALWNTQKSISSSLIKTSLFYKVRVLYHKVITKEKPSQKIAPFFFLHYFTEPYSSSCPKRKQKTQQQYAIPFRKTQSAFIQERK
jgi:hypothetical protein